MTDTERLDWIERAGIEVRCWTVHGARRYYASFYRAGRARPVQAGGETLRQAVDALMGEVARYEREGSS
jgi:hypothetical protein